MTIFKNIKIIIYRRRYHNRIIWKSIKGSKNSKGYLQTQGKTNN